MGRRPPYRLIAVGIIVIIVLAISTSAFDYPIVFLGRVTTDTYILDPEGAQSVTAVIVAQTGEIRVEGGAAGLLNADIAYAYEGDKPTVAYHTGGIRADGSGTLLITQGEYEDLILLGGTRINDWAIMLGDSVPLDLTLDVGAGDLDADLTGLAFIRLRLEATSGDLAANLSSLGGSQSQNLDVTVIADSGDITLHLPEQTGVRVLIESEMGRIDAGDFALAEGDYTGTYVNAAYADAQDNKQDNKHDNKAGIIIVRITSGRGNVTLRSE